MSLSDEALAARDCGGGNRYPKKTSLVTVYYRETGEVKEFAISAGPGIAPHLCRQTVDTGFLVLLNGDESTCIPADVIERFEMKEVKLVEEEPHSE